MLCLDWLLCIKLVSQVGPDMIGKVTYLLLPLFGRFFEHRLVEGALFPELLNGLQLFGQRRLDQLIDGFMSEVEIEACFDDGLQEAILGLPS